MKVVFSYGTAVLVPFLVSGCLFDMGNEQVFQGTRFDFSRLDSLENPFSRWFPISREENLVGVKFAFTSLEYKHQVDSNIAAFTFETGRIPAIAGAYFDLSSQPKNLRTFLEAVDGNGAIPFITLDPKDWDEDDTVFQKTFVSRILAGHFDDTLKALARTCRDFGKPALFRFAHEMNGDWYFYSGKNIGGGSDANRDGRPDGPENYIAAWRRVHGIFNGEGATNLVWVFCPNVETFPAEEWNRPFRYYPGPEYVDMLSVDSYEYPDKRLRDLEAVLGGFFGEMGRFFETHEGEPGFALKPFGLSEFGTFRADAGSKADWYDTALKYIGSQGRFKISVQYMTRNPDRDFSIAGLGPLLRDAYAQARFRFGLASSPAVAGR